MNIEIKSTSGQIISYESGQIISYEIVEKIPAGFFVWNIGENMGTDEYIPLCEYLHHEDKDDYSINVETLKAIKLKTESIKILREAAQWGGLDCLKDTVKTLKRINNKIAKGKQLTSYEKIKKPLAEKVLPIFEQITE